MIVEDRVEALDTLNPLNRLSKRNLQPINSLLSSRAASNSGTAVASDGVIERKGEF